MCLSEPGKCMEMIKKCEMCANSEKSDHWNNVSGEFLFSENVGMFGAVFF